MIRYIILCLIAAINYHAWANKATNMDDVLFLFPSISIITTLLIVRPKIKRGKIQIKILYFVLFGIIYLNTPLYFEALINKNEIFNRIFSLGISPDNFILANYLLGISLPLLVLGYILPMKNYRSSSSYILKPIKIWPFISLFLLFTISSIAITGFTIGSTFVGTSSYYYILAFRAGIITCAIFVYQLERKRIYKAKYPTFFEIKYILMWFSLGLFIFYVLIGGDRGPVLTLTLVLGFAFLITNNMKVEVHHLVLGLIFIVFAYMLFVYIGILRQSEETSFSFDLLANTMSDYYNNEFEKGSTIRTTALAIDGIENERYPHTKGKFMFQSLIKGIPFIGPLFIEKLFGQNYIDGTAELLTIQYYGIGYTSGIGTSYLADVFIEFGIIGIVIFSFLYGRMIRFFDLLCQEERFKNFHEILLISLFVGFSIYLGRGTLTAFIVYFLHTLILFLAFQYFVNLFGVKIFRKEDKI